MKALIHLSFRALGCKLGYENGEWHTTESYRFALGGGPGIEVILYDHFVYTLGGGYAFFAVLQNNKETRVDVNFTFEVSAGYLF
ncbi:hypothetical protein [Thermospira aquatica]|uniref:Outer membrane protein beta-barrel domain-containing protein n=1 Tax=Thermospira aquatica TaxID=2828656 RepID=A0AAX3BEW2_9SPIR|nr:hypothetical protein [Thermospira aquatica]URA10736.1 hypothetical protein KDW03_02735 [Thermospira aquatica]